MTEWVPGGNLGGTQKMRVLVRLLCWRYQQRQCQRQRQGPDKIEQRKCPHEAIDITHVSSIRSAPRVKGEANRMPEHGLRRQDSEAAGNPFSHILANACCQ